MPRSAVNNTLLPLLQRLTAKLGEQQARSELRWMAEHARAAIKDPHKRAEVRSHLGARLWRDQPAPSAGEMERDSQRLSAVQWAWLRQAVSERTEKHKPLQYILGNQPFGKAKIGTRPPVLIPRWETEEWMLRLAEMINGARTTQQLANGRVPIGILDACSGSGCISLGLACELAAGTANITGVDISAEATSLATDNLKSNLHSVQNPVEFRMLDLQDAAGARAALQADGSRRIDMVVSNPPYVTPAEYAELDPDVRDWEDVRALVPMPAGSDPRKVGADSVDSSGTSFIVLLAKLARDLGLADNARNSPSTDLPRLVVEIGGTAQVEATRQAMHDCGFNLTEVWKDMAGTDRVVLGFVKT
ncbi:hypothetical protein GGF46_001165 [Coemansia sp. RSA 552]|nr:hypothetical protein GGF46_001165 [Coemansia sp. RSA 552]